MLNRNEDTPKAGNRAMWRPEHKKLSRMKNMGWKLSRPGDLLMDYCAVKCSTTEACLLADQHRKFVVCGIDSEPGTAAEPDPVLPFGSQMQNTKSDISGNAEGISAAKVSRKVWAAVLARKKASGWEVPLRLDAIQVLPGPLLHIITTTIENYSFHEMCCHLF